jgi:hypothetical protein
MITLTQPERDLLVGLLGASIKKNRKGLKRLERYKAEPHAEEKTQQVRERIAKQEQLVAKLRQRD